MRAGEIYLVVAVLSLAAVVRAGASLNLTTGLDASNNLITVGGTPDANWTVDAVSGGTAAAQIVTPKDADWWGGWGANGPNSDWIARSASTGANGPAPYSFYRTFDLGGYDPGAVSISGAWELDDEGTLSLNGHQLDMHVWDQWNQGLLTFSVPAGSPYLVQGMNTLTITETRNDNFFEAVRLEGTITLGRRLLPGDADDDGSVGFDDLLNVARNYDKGGGWTQGDFNGDGAVGFDDLLIVARNYGATLTSSQLTLLDPALRADVQAAFAEVPEPSLLAFPALLAGLLMRRERVLGGCGAIGDRSNGAKAPARPTERLVRERAATRRED